MYPEIDLKIESEEIVAKERKLKAVWSYEAAQDLKAWHGIDTSYALADLLAQEITAELDDEILRDLRANADIAERAEKEKGYKDKSIAYFKKKQEETSNTNATLSISTESS